MITILTTHHLEEAEILSDRLSVLSFGEIIVSGTVSKIKKTFGVGYEISIFPDSNVEELSESFKTFSEDLKTQFKNHKIEF